MSTDVGDDALWRPIAVLGGDLDDDAIDRLVDHLAGTGPEGVRGPCPPHVR